MHERACAFIRDFGFSSGCGLVAGWLDAVLFRRQTEEKKMKCPRCSHVLTLWGGNYAWCPHCKLTFSLADLEELTREKQEITEYEEARA